MARAVEKVRKRLVRMTSALQHAGIPHAVIGGNAIAAWVSRVDETAARNTRDVDVLIRRVDLDAAIAALTRVGFHYRHMRGRDFFLDKREGGVREGIHVVFAGELARPDHVERAPEVSEIESGESFALLRLEALVRMN